MNEFELYTMIFYAVDLYYESNPSEDLGEFLGMMSPFTFKEIGSADSAIYLDFCGFINNREITIDNSLEYAKEYVETIEYCDVKVVFSEITEEKWNAACTEYLKNPHKGAQT